MTKLQALKLIKALASELETDWKPAAMAWPKEPSTHFINFMHRQDSSCIVYMKFNYANDKDIKFQMVFERRCLEVPNHECFGAWKYKMPSTFSATDFPHAFKDLASKAEPQEILDLIKKYREIWATESSKIEEKQTKLNENWSHIAELQKQGAALTLNGENNYKGVIEMGKTKINFTTSLDDPNGGLTAKFELAGQEALNLIKSVANGSYAVAA